MTLTIKANRGASLDDPGAFRSPMIRNLHRTSYIPHLITRELYDLTKQRYLCTETLAFGAGNLNGCNWQACKNRSHFVLGVQRAFLNYNLVYDSLCHSAQHPGAALCT